MVSFRLKKKGKEKKKRKAVPALLHAGWSNGIPARSNTCRPNYGVFVLGGPARRCVRPVWIFFALLQARPGPKFAAAEQLQTTLYLTSSVHVRHRTCLKNNIVKKYLY